MVPSAPDPRWYEPVNPNEHSYTPGYGFSTRPPFIVEQRLIASYSTAAAFALLGFLFLSSLLPHLLSYLAFRFLPAPLPHAIGEILVEVIRLVSAAVALLIPFWGFAAFTHIPRRYAVPLRRVDPRLTVAAVAICMAVSVVGSRCSAILLRLFSQLGLRFTGDFARPESLPAYLLFLLNMTVIPAVFEEIAFHGMLMQPLRRFGDSFALVSSSLIFSFVHLSPVKMPYAFLTGLIIGYFVLFTGSVSAGMVIHFIHNALVALVGVFEYLPGEAASISLGAYELLCLLLGFWVVTEMLRRYDGFFSLKPSSTINLGEDKLRVFLCSVPMFLFYLAVIWQAVNLRT